MASDRKIKSGWTARVRVAGHDGEFESAFRTKPDAEKWAIPIEERLRGISTMRGLPCQKSTSRKTSCPQHPSRLPSAHKRPYRYRKTCRGQIGALERMALTLSPTHVRASELVGEHEREIPSTMGRVWVFVFAFAARYVQADGRLCVGRST